MGLVFRLMGSSGDGRDGGRGVGVTKLRGRSDVVRLRSVGLWSRVGWSCGGSVDRISNVARLKVTLLVAAGARAGWSTTVSGLSWALCTQQW